MEREAELRQAIARADLLPRDKAILTVLLDRARWATAMIEDRFQPRGTAELAGWCHMPARTLLRGLGHLEHHKWIERTRVPGAGAGHGTTYQLLAGEDCYCRVKTEPMTDAERARRYRQRKKTVPDSRDGTVPLQRDGTVPDSRDASRQNGVDVYATRRDDFAGQPVFSAKRVREEGNGGPKPTTDLGKPGPFEIVPGSGFDWERAS